MHARDHRRPAAALQRQTRVTGALNEGVMNIVLTLGYPGIALLVMLETLFPPIPSEVILPLAGFLAGQGQLALVGVIVAATGGSLAGALALYAVGRWYGEARLRGFNRRHGRWLLVREADLDRAKEWFNRHSGTAVLIGRWAPGIRSIISIPAGLIHMPLGRFIAYTVLGSLMWNSALVMLGWWLGREWERAQAYTRYLEYAVIAGGLVAIAWFLWSRRDALRDWR